MQLEYHHNIDIGPKGHINCKHNIYV